MNSFIYLSLSAFRCMCQCMYICISIYPCTYRTAFLVSIFTLTGYHCHALGWLTKMNLSLQRNVVGISDSLQSSVSAFLNYDIKLMTGYLINCLALWWASVISRMTLLFSSLVLYFSLIRTGNYFRWCSEGAQTFFFLYVYHFTLVWRTLLRGRSQKIKSICLVFY